MEGDEEEDEEEEEEEDEVRCSGWAWAGLRWVALRWAGVVSARARRLAGGQGAGSNVAAGAATPCRLLLPRLFEPPLCHVLVSTLTPDDLCRLYLYFFQEEVEYLDEEQLGFDPTAEDMEDWSDEEYSGSGAQGGRARRG